MKLTSAQIKITARLGDIDLIINNRVPPIRDLQFLEQSIEVLLAFVTNNLRIKVETARHLLPLLAQGGQLGPISKLEHSSILMK